jgi:two-component system LytT family response regulator
MKCIAIDDEPLALAQISAYINKVPFLELIKSCSDAFEAMKVLSEEKIELMFIDINMPDLNGMEFVRSLSVRPLIIFTTAYSEYAVDGFKVDAVDYLLKPFSFQDLLKASEKARHRAELMKNEQSLDTNDKVIDTPQVDNDSIFVKSDYRIVRISINDIKYIEGMSEYVRIFVTGEPKPIISLLSMKKLENLLSASHFLRVHRSYIVNMQKIVEVSRLRIIFDKDTYIPIGDNYKDKFNEYINGRSINGK